MTLKLLTEVSPQELLEGLADLQNHLIGYVKSMSLRCAVDLGIPDAIHRRGGTATLADIATDTKVHPSKVADLKRVLDLLTASGIFSATAAAREDGAGAVLYGLTTTCRFLVGWRNLSPMVPFLVNPLVVTSFFSMPDWLRSEPGGAGSLFELEHGCSQWEMGRKDTEFNTILNGSMAADSQVFLEVIMLDKGRIFRGLRSLVDVGGGKGAGTKVIASAFPRIKCTVMDLPHVIVQDDAGDDGHENLQFLAGDMFESIPSADAVVLKNILHDWDHENCVKILKRCKQAIPARNAGGKVIIIDMVRGLTQEEKKTTEMEAIQNMFMIYISGVERNESEWKAIFYDAGFSEDCKIMPVLGPYSVIEIYP